MAKNVWRRDELILALDLFFNRNPLSITAKHPDIVELSSLLRKMPHNLENVVSEEYRNPNSVYMKLCNFLRFDPSYNGVGLQKGSKAEKKVWEDFYNQRDYLHNLASDIRYYLQHSLESNALDAPEDEYFEGALIIREHKRRERNVKLIKLAKENSKEKNNGHLICEVCGFDFSEVYGDLGENFIECHHEIPLSFTDKKRKVSISDLRMLCSNCHSMVHYKKPWLTVDELSAIYSEYAGLKV